MINSIDNFEHYKLINFHSNFNIDNDYLDSFKFNKSINNLLSLNTNKIPDTKQPDFSKSFINSFEENSIESQSFKSSSNIKSDIFCGNGCKDENKIIKDEDNIHRNKISIIKKNL